jgi:hypothetical protein
LKCGFIDYGRRSVTPATKIRRYHPKMPKAVSWGPWSMGGAVRGGINSLMGDVLEDHIRFHLTLGSKEQIAPELAEDLIDLVHAYLK